MGGSGCDPEDLLRQLNPTARCGPTCTAPVEYITEVYSGAGDGYSATCVWCLPKTSRRGPLQAIRTDGRWELASSWLWRAEQYTPHIVAPTLARPDVYVTDREASWPMVWAHRWLQRAATDLRGRTIPADALERLDAILEWRHQWDDYIYRLCTEEDDSTQDAPVNGANGSATAAPAPNPFHDDLVAWLNWLLVVPDFSLERLARRAELGLICAPGDGPTLFAPRREIVKHWAARQRADRRSRAAWDAEQAKWRTADGTKLPPGPIPGPDGRPGGAYLHDQASLRSRLEAVGAVLRPALDRLGIDAEMTLHDRLNWTADRRWESFGDPLKAPVSLQFRWSYGPSVASAIAALSAAVTQIQPNNGDLLARSVLFDDVDGRYEVGLARDVDRRSVAMIDARNLIITAGREELDSTYDRDPFDVPDPATLTAAEELLAHWCEARPEFACRPAYRAIRPFLVEIAMSVGSRWPPRRRRRLVDMIDADIATDRADVLTVERIAELRARTRT